MLATGDDTEQVDVDVVSDVGEVVVLEPADGGRRTSIVHDSSHGSELFSRGEERLDRALIHRVHLDAQRPAAKRLDLVCDRRR